jgi:hypothetical protein
MSQMGEVVLLGSAWEADIDLRHIELEFSRNEEINSEIHPDTPQLRSVTMYESS